MLSHNAIKTQIEAFFGRYFGDSIDLGVQSFNLLGFAGIMACAAVSAISFLQGAFVNASICFFFLLATCCLMRIAGTRVSYHACKWLVVAVVFMLGFPFMFFFSGGYVSGMPCFFVFAFLFTTIMLGGLERVFALCIEFVLYAGCCVAAYIRPEIIVYFDSDIDVLIDVLTGIVVCGALLMLIVLLHLRMYDVRNRELEKANDKLYDLNRMKTEFLANVSHEMKTPLTVTSVNIQTAMDMISEASGTVLPDAGRLLDGAHGEIMRLSRMVEGMLTQASMSENTDLRQLDYSALVESGVEAMRINVGKRGNVIKTDIVPGLFVYGDADMLAQTLINIIQNAGKHTREGVISVSAKPLAGYVRTEVRDTGSGIPQELLPRVFERGVSSGGSGFGLHLCKAAVESCGGEIWITSEMERGTSVCYILPAYEAQPAQLPL